MALQIPTIPRCNLSLVHHPSLYPNYVYPYTNTLIAKIYNIDAIPYKVQLLKSNMIKFGDFESQVLAQNSTHDNINNFQCYFRLGLVENYVKRDSAVYCLNWLTMRWYINADVEMSLLDGNHKPFFVQRIQHHFDKFNPSIKYDMSTMNEMLLIGTTKYYKHQCLTISIKFTIMDASIPSPKPVTLDFKNNLMSSKVMADKSVTINETVYPLCSHLVKMNCPMLLWTWTHDLMSKANLSSASINHFLKLIHHQPLINIDDFDTLIQMKWLSMLLNTRFISFEKMYDHYIIPALVYADQDQHIRYLTDAFALAVLYPAFVKEVYTLMQHVVSRHSLDEYFFESVIERISSAHIARFMALITAKSINKVKIYTIDVPNNEPTFVFNDMLMNLASATQPTLDMHEYNDAALAFRKAHLSSIPKPNFVIKTMDGGQYNIHGWFLYARWSYFQKMIDFGGKETSERQMTLSEDWNTSRLQQFLKYIYGISCEFKHQDDALWILEHGRCYDWIDAQDQPTLGFESLIKSCNNHVFDLHSLEICGKLQSNAIKNDDDSTSGRL